MSPCGFIGGMEEELEEILLAAGRRNSGVSPLGPDARGGELGCSAHPALRGGRYSIVKSGGRFNFS